MKLITLTALAYDTGIVPTVTVDRDGVAVRINESDYDPETMVLFDAPAPSEPAAPAPSEPAAPAPSEPAAPAPAPSLLVMKSGGKFFISDAVGTKIEGEAAAALGITETGYATEAKAQAALAGITTQA